MKSFSILSIRSFRTLIVAALSITLTGWTSINAEAHSGGSCMLEKVPFEQTVKSSSLIVEGQVISTRSFWNDAHTMIYTSQIVRIEYIIKGQSKEKQISVLSLGGSVGRDFVQVDPELHLLPGAKGIFCLNPSPFESKLQPGTHWTPVAGLQGFVQYDLDDAKAELPFESFDLKNDEAVVHIAEWLGLPKPTRISAFPLNPAKAAGNGNTVATFTSFNPTTVSAGNGDILTINGSGFGAIPGKVEFTCADFDAATFTQVVASDILSWTDTQIQVAVPGITKLGTQVAGAAGTGPVRVTTSANVQFVSPGNLTVSYSHINLILSNKRVSFQMVNDNGTGGYTWQYAPGFSAVAGAVTSFERAANSWKCEAGANFTFSTLASAAPVTDAVTQATVDGINSVMFDDAAVSLAPGVLGQTFIKGFAGCQVGGVFTNLFTPEIDLVFSRNANGSNWDFQQPNVISGLVGQNKMDFLMIALHELGHCLLLGHNRNAGAIMKPTFGINQFNRVPSQLDKNAVDASIIKSTPAIPCAGAPTGYVRATNAPHTVTLSVNGSSNACTQNLVTFNATSASFYPNPSFTWYKNGTLIMNAGTSVYSSPDFVPGDVVTVSSSSCGNSITSSGITITGTPVSAVTSPGPITGPTCITAGVASTYSIPVVPNATAYTWTAGNATTVVGATTIGAAAVTAPVTFQGSDVLRVQASNFCSTGLLSAPVSVTRTPAVPATISGPVTNVCLSTKTYSVPAVAGVTSLAWTVSNGATFSGPVNGPSVNITFGASFPNSGVIGVRAISTGCTSSTKSLTVSELPVVPASVKGPSVISGGSNVTYSVSNPDNGTVRWTVKNSLGTTLFSGTGNPVTFQIPVFFGSTTVTLCATLTNACGTTQPVCRTVQYGLLAARTSNPTEQLPVLTAFPNPTKDQIKLHAEELEPFATMEVRIMDLMGKIVYDKSFDPDDVTADFDVDLRNSVSGIYIGTIKQGTRMSTIRIIKE